MQREIKFRAWGGDERKYFVHFGLFGQEGGYFTDEYIQPDDSQHVIDYEDVIAIQQFTGLKDKNGKEIYEGDVVEYDKDFQGKPFYGRVSRFEVGFALGSFLLRDPEIPANNSGGGFTGIYAHSLALTVVGNIYENPQLLK